MENKTVLTREEYFKKYGNDVMEVSNTQMMEVDYPKPLKRWRLIYESYQKSIEHLYFWSLNHWKYDQMVAWIDKVTDLFAASEHSSFFGVAQQRIGLQQDKVSQFLATIGKMVKELFQLVRELRILDERLSYYNDSLDLTSKSRESAEITLKGIWIDLVEQGAKNPASVYGMARELGFVTLPDLFFSVNPGRIDRIDEMVNDLEFNRKVKEVLKRKLRQFMEWKKSTHKEITTRRLFTLKYLRQHFNIIKMYMTWVKPYLKNIQRLKTDDKRIESAELIAAFEGSFVEIELLCRSVPHGNKDYYAVAIQTFEYRTRPSMSYQQEGYQRGPIHIGETKVTYRTYAWTEEDIKNYLEMRSQEDFELLSVISGSVQAAMEALGDELKGYLVAAGEAFPTADITKKREEKKKERPRGFFSSIFGSHRPKQTRPKKKRLSGVDKARLEKEKKVAAYATNGTSFLHYKNLKKSNGFFHW